MKSLRTTACLFGLCAIPALLPGQAPAAAAAAPAAPEPWHSYDAGPLWRIVFGGNWRVLWKQPLTAPTLDLGGFAGGLTPLKRGGNQTETLHFRAGDGRRYVFRAIVKRAGVVAGNADLRSTFAAHVIQDQESTKEPAGPGIADVLQTAAGVLHAPPQLVTMPDDPRLGEFRREFAGKVGYIELKPANESAAAAVFAGADKIRETDELLDELDASLVNRIDARAWLTAQLLDAVMGDFDRGADQWAWARFDSGGVHVYRPIARDRDWAFMRTRGIVLNLARREYRKMGSFDRHNETTSRVTFMTHEFDRSELVGLSRGAWDSTVVALQAALTARVIDSAVRAAPVGEPRTLARISGDLKARVATLPALARALFRMVNGEADVFAADGRELAEIDRNPDGSVRVRLSRCDAACGPASEGAAFDRVFTPDATHEIRVYLQEGDDRAIVRGSAERSILVRVIGGGGNDQLIDSSRVSHGGARTVFYDASGRNTIVRGPDTRTDTRAYTVRQPGRLAAVDTSDTKAPPPRTVQEERRGRFEDQRIVDTADVVAQRLQGNEPRAWGSAAGLGPVLRITEDDGIIFGAKYGRTSWGFRQDPFATRWSASVLYATGAPGFGGDVLGEWHPENSSRSMTLHVAAINFAINRFYGYGNDTPFIDDAHAVIDRDDIVVQPMVHWAMGTNTSIGVGPVARFSAPSFAAGSPMALQHPVGSADFGAAGGAFTFDRVSVDDPALLHAGYRLQVDASEFPALWDAKDAFGSATVEAAGYLPLGPATLALRAGGKEAWGAYPLQEAAYAGGIQTLRGYVWNRFVGDASAHGSTELRVPLLRIDPFVRGDLGVILLGDAGRVWYHGNSPGGWHTSVGGGLSFASLHHAVSLVYAHGEVSRLYFNFGFPF